MTEMFSEDQPTVMESFVTGNCMEGIKRTHLLFVEGFRDQLDDAPRAASRCMNDLNSAYLPVSVLKV